MKSPPANPCVIAHFIGRGACVYCRLLSVLLMQIIKFGGKLVVNPHCFSIERHDFKRNKANFRILLVDGLHCRDWARQFYVSLYIPPKPVATAFFHLRGVMYLYITYYISIRIWCQYWCQWCQRLSRHQFFQKCSARSVPSIPSVLPHRFPLSF